MEYSILINSVSRGNPYVIVSDIEFIEFSHCLHELDARFHANSIKCKEHFDISFISCA